MDNAPKAKVAEFLAQRAEACARGEHVWVTCKWGADDAQEERPLFPKIGQRCKYCLEYRVVDWTPARAYSWPE
jgi:hypothetical protein